MRLARAAVATALCLPFVACASDPTQIVVVVDSDLLTPMEMNTVRVLVRGEDRTITSEHSFSLTAMSTPPPGTVKLPFSLAVVPAGGADLSQVLVIEVEAIGRREDGSSGTLFVRRAITGFLEERSLQLPMFLARQCTFLSCDSGETCSERGCIDERVPPEVLPESLPGEELASVDAGIGLDSGLHPDARSIDSGVIETRDADPVETGVEVDAAPMDAQPMDAQPMDALPMDALPMDAAPVEPIDSGIPPPIDSGVPPPFDSGIPPPIDSGVPPPFDSGFPPPMDSGVPPPFDSGMPPPFDSGFPPPFDSGMPPPLDSGMPPPFDSGFPMFDGGGGRELPMAPLDDAGDPSDSGGPITLDGGIGGV